ncbi:hypothetical protein M011DRAFT_512941 [Sporormia fimetaria CBS 119925]|uniref:Uncharacterized protein n=1 Tax=Sporormia fimetaria CBS 119925 TaxID=1340428 RepID=A0A6A6UUY9_9PLEO|nr:hypothetical protein M011DRAFT_512941 [Sporormia fimetaria CBS 119925]
MIDLQKDPIPTDANNDHPLVSISSLLCAYCQALRLPELPHGRPSPEYGYVIYDRTAQQMRDACAIPSSNVQGSGSDSTPIQPCQFCNFLLREASEASRRGYAGMPESITSVELIGDGRAIFSVEAAWHQPRTWCIVVLSFYGFVTGTSCATRYRGPNYEIIQESALTNIIVTEKDYPDVLGNPTCSPLRLVDPDPLSGATVGLITHWLSACREHAECSPMKPRPLPTRVIDVREDKVKSSTA